jgi:trimethylamine-N-oxide reductase (cytochrome c)
MNSSRRIGMYRNKSIDLVVSQAIWDEGEAQFADIILPACSVVERHDISEVSACGAFAHHNQIQMNHRMVVMQHQCIKPLWESRSDYRIFTDILTRLDFGAMFSEGSSELDWCKRIFDSTDAVNHTSWTKLLKKGYVVFPNASDKERDPVYMRWLHEGGKKNVPEPHPLPGGYSGNFLDGLQTQSGKIEFIPNSLKRGDPDNDERPVLNRYFPGWEGPANEELAKKYPLQLATGHPRHSFHSHLDGKGTHINEIPDHRIRVDGYAYWVVRMNDADAKARGLKDRDLVKVYNDRGTVICAVEVSPLVAPGTIKSYESCAEFDFIEDKNGKIVDRGGCMNLLTPSRTQAKGTTAIAPNSCQIEIAKWTQKWEAVQ